MDQLKALSLQSVRYLQRASIIGTLMLSRNIKNVPGAGRSN